MLVSRVVVVLLLIFIQDINVTGIVRRNPVGDDECYTDISSGSGQDTLMNNDSNYYDDVYTNYSDCSFNHELVTLTSNGQIIIQLDVMLLSVILLVDLENITIIGHDSPTVNCDNAGGLHFNNCHNCTIIGIMWEKCGNINDSKPAIQLYNSSNINIESCSFKHSATQAIVLSQMSGKVTISSCDFAFNNQYKDNGVAIHYLSRINHHFKFQFAINKCNFTHNGMTTNQSVVYIGPSSSKYMEQIFLMDLIFLNNRGTPIYISNQNFSLSGNMLVKGNVADRGGGIFIDNHTESIFHKLDIKFINNNASYGGAIYIDANANINFEGNCRVTISDNQAYRYGGGIYINNNSDVIFRGNSTVTINGNQADSVGGALYIRNNSNVTFEGNSTVTINNNQADYYGGALYIVDNSDVTSVGNSTVTIYNNQADYSGGALYIRDNCDVTFEGSSTVTIYNNQADYSGGALYIVDNSDVTFEGSSTVTIYNNQADSGGALYIMDNSDVTFEGSSTVTINNNQADYSGGALYIRDNSDVTFEGSSTVTIYNNQADYSGGALLIVDNSDVTFEGSSTVTIYNNQADDGGALYIVHNSDVTFKGSSTVTINNNKAVMNGGALYCDHSIVTMNEHSTVIFIHNIAENGGAVSISFTFLLISDHSNVTFGKNIAEQDGGAIYFNREDNNIIFENSSTVTLTSNIADRGGAIYSKIAQNLKYFNIIEINFSDNTARVAGSLLYIDVSQSCNTSCLTDRTAGISAEILQHVNAKKLITTSPNKLILYYPAKCISSNSARCEKYYIDNIMLGQELAIHACLFDYYNEPAEVTQFRIVGEKSQNYDIHGSEYTSISCNHIIGGISIIGNDIITSSSLNYSILFTSNLVLNITRRNISVDLTVELSPCHSGFQYHGKSQTCECYNNSEIVQCSGSISSIKRGYWFGHVTGVPTITYCPINYCNFTCCKATNGYYDLSPVRVNQCRSRRSGIACGNCEDGHTLSFDSPECISNNKCSTRQSILVVTLTVLYWFIAVMAVFIIMYYQIGIGYFYAVTYYYSVVDILLSQITDLSNELYTAVTIMSSIAKVTPQFLGQLCLLKDMSGIDQQFIHYVHPLAVSLILIIISWLAKHLKRFSAFVSRVIIHAICFLLLLSYTSVATTSLLLMRSLTFADVKYVYTYLSPDTQYFHDRHLVYGIIAIIVALLIVIGLPLLLLLEPFLNRKINFIRIKPLLDQFQGCYKDKYRCFAAYYMICRLIIITIIIANIPEEFISRYLLITATTVIALIHLVVRPYTDNILNISDGAILQLMVLVSALLLFESFDTFDSSSVVGIAFVFVILPLVQFVVLMIFISKQKIKEIIKNTNNRFTFKFKSHANEPDNINNNMANNDFDLVIDNDMRRNATICEM